MNLAGFISGGYSLNVLGREEVFFCLKDHPAPVARVVLEHDPNDTNPQSPSPSSGSWLVLAWAQLRSSQLWGLNDHSQLILWIVVHHLQPAACPSPPGDCIVRETIRGRGTGPSGLTTSGFPPICIIFLHYFFAFYACHTFMVLCRIPSPADPSHLRPAPSPSSRK